MGLGCVLSDRFRLGEFVDGKFLLVVCEMNSFSSRVWLVWFRGGFSILSRDGFGAEVDRGWCWGLSQVVYGHFYLLNCGEIWVLA